MKKLDENELLKCKFVADLFEYSTKEKDASSKLFIKAYMYSSIKKIISSKSFFLDSLDVPMAYEMIKKEKKLTRGNEIYPSYVMSWIGYIYEYFICATGINGTYIYSKIKPEELYSLYEAYHSLDNDMVIQRLAEAKKISTSLNDVNIYKNIKLSTNGINKRAHS